MKGYVICTTPRSGSNLLCEALKNTGVAGCPDEYFGNMHVPNWMEHWELSSSKDYANRVRDESSTSNGIWGVKIMMQYFDDVYEQLQNCIPYRIEEKFDALEAAYGNLDYIYMSRKNKVKQSISLHKAHQNFIWKVPVGDALLDESSLSYDFDEIDRIHSSLVDQEISWEKYFQYHGRSPHRIFYEDLVEDYANIMQGVLDYLGVDYAFNFSLLDSRLRRQSNQISEQWAERYISEKN